VGRQIQARGPGLRPQRNTPGTARPEVFASVLDARLLAVFVFLPQVQKAHVFASCSIRSHSIRWSRPCIPLPAMDQQLVEKLPWQPSASLRGARSLACLLDGSRSLRAVASQLAARVQMERSTVGEQL